MYKAIIIDDEEMARTLLKGLIENFCQQVEVVDSCPDLPTGVKSIYKNKPHLVFLDIEMPGHSGLELLEFFNIEEINFHIIFVTAYNKYAIQAFKLSAIDYLLKPVEIEDLQKAIELFEKKIDKQNLNILKNNFQQPQKKIAVHGSNSVKYIHLDDILLLEAEGSYTKLYLKNDNILIASKNLKFFEDTLYNFKNFFRSHKSFIINLNHVTEHSKNKAGYIIIDHKHKVTVSSDKFNEMLNLIEEF